MTAPRPAHLDSPRGWLVVAGTAVGSFTVFGILYSFGSFFSAMAKDFGTGKGATALMFAVTLLVTYVLGLWTGRLADRHGPRPVLLVGAVALGAGLLATSRVGSIAAGYVTYGLGMGIATACAYVPMVANVGAWFERRRTVALGVAVAGIGVGTLVLAPLSTRLIDRYGWRTSYVVLGVGGAVALALCSIVAARPPGAAATAVPDLRPIVTDRRFVLLYLASLTMSTCLFVPFVFLKPYAEDEGIGAGAAATLVGIVGASSLIGRLGLGALGARNSPGSLLRLSFAVLSGSFVLWLVAGGSYPVLVAFAVTMGIGYGGFIALMPAFTAGLFGTAGLGGILGALYTSAGVGGLLGPPLAGSLIDATSYRAGMVVAMAFGVVATVVLGLVPGAAHHKPN
jgi:MFS family permease